LRLACSLLAGALSLVLTRVAFCGAFSTSDETSYLFQAHCFLDGCIARAVPPMPPIFQHYMNMTREPYGWMSRYPPGHALFLLPGVLLQAPRLMVAMAAALSVWFLSGCARFLSVRPGIVLALLLGSPWFLLMYGTLLSHTSAHLGLAIAIWGCLGWVTQRRRGYAAACGLAFGFLFLTRNFTAVLVGTPFALLALTDFLRKRERAVLAGWALAALGAALGVGLFLLYNRLAVGDWLTLPYIVYDSSEGLGFGLRHQNYHPGVVHTWQRGVEMMATRLRLEDRWLFGVPGGLVLLLALSLAGWTLPWSPVLLGAAAVLWTGHIVFFTTTLDNVGPYYYFESLPCLVLAGALGIQRLAARLPRRRAAALAALAVLALAAACGWSLWREGRRLRGDLAYNGRLFRLLRKAPPDALIMLDRITPRHGDMVVNLRGLESRPLLAKHMGDDVALVTAKLFPDRVPYVMSQGFEETLIPFKADRLLDIPISAEAFHGYTGRLETPPGEAPRRTGRAGRDLPHWLGCRAFAWLCPGRFAVSFTGSTRDVAEDKPVTLSVVDYFSHAVLAERTMSGTHGLSTLVLPVEVSTACYVEALVHYAGSGAADLYSIRFQEQPPEAASGAVKRSGT